MLRTERMKTNGRNGKMKLTKSKLKQLIKEAFEDEEELLATAPEGEEDDDDSEAWVRELEDFMEQSVDLYNSLPNEGKEHMTKNFQMYFEKWEEELEGGTEEEEEDEDEGEYEMLPRGENPMGRGPQTSQLRRKSTNWRPGEDFYGID